METFLYITILLCSFYASVILVPNTNRRFPYCTFLIGTLLIGCLILQFIFPSLLPLFERNSSLISMGQWWRLLSASFFQDGGLVGGISNIFFLILIGTVTEQLFARERWLAIYFGVGLLTEIVALVWQPVGAGNSIAIFGLAGAITTYAFLRFHHSWKIVLPILSSLTALVLLMQKDIHGAAFAIGALFYFLFRKTKRVGNN